MVTGSGDTYDVAVSGISSDGTVTADVDANGAEDAAGNGNTASTSTDNTVTFDTTNPEVAVNQKAGQDDPTNTQPIEFTATFTEPVTGFDETDVTLGGTAGSGSATVTVTGGGDTYNIAVSGLTSDGTLTAEIGVNAAEDAAQNGNNASTSTDNEVTYDNTDPESEASSPAFSNASATTIPVDYTASDNLSGLDKVELWAKKNAGDWELADSDTSPGISGQFVYTPSPGDGTYRFYTIAVDNAGNREAVPTETDTITIKADSTTLRDTVAPAPTLNTPPAFTNDDTPAIAGTAGTQGADSTHSDDDDHVTVRVFSGTTEVQTHTNVPVDSGDGSFEVDATHLADGAYTARVDQSDAAGNGGFDERDFEVDTARPGVSVEQAGTQDDPTDAQPIHFTAVFTEPVTGFDETDVTLDGTAGLGSALVVVTGSGDTYDIAVSGISSDGTVSAGVDANGAVDAAGNGNTASTSADNTVTYDATAPEVDSIDRDDASPTNAASVSWTVTFSEPVTGVNADDFALASSGLGGTPAITNVTGSDDTYTVTASTGSGSGTLGLNLVDDDSIEDAATNKLDGGFTGEVYDIDRDGPTVTVNQKTGQADPTNAQPIEFTAEFSEPVTGFDETDVSVTGTAGGAPTVVVTGSGDSYNIAVSGLTSDGTVIVNVAADRAADDAGNGNAESTSTDNTVTYDTTAPVVQSINRADPSPTNASSVSWTVTFSEPVTGVDATDFALMSASLGGTPAITNVTGSDATYTVTASTGSGSGVLRLNLVDDDSIEDAATNKLGGTGAGNGGFIGEAYTIDRLAPSVTVEQAGGQTDPTNTQPIHFTAVFTEPVTGFGPGDVTLGGSAGHGSATVTITPLMPNSYDIAVSGLTSDGTLTASIGADSASDGAGNGNSASTSADNSVTYDTGAPTVTSIDRADANPTSAASVSWTVTFSESVTGVDATDFALANTGLGGSPAITNVTGSGATRTVTASTGSGSGTLGLNLVDDDSIEDAASNKLAGGFTGQLYTLDRSAPTVSSINRADANPTSAASVSWTVTFSESVTGVNAADFALANSGLGGTPAITNVTGGPVAYTVTASTGTGSGTLGLNLVDDDSIADGVGNKLGGTGNGNGNFTGQVYTVDRGAPPPTFAFTGFSRPIDNLPIINQVKAGSAVPIKFGLGGNRGMNIFAPGYPISQVIPCNSTAPVDGVEQIDSPGNSGLSYDAGSQTYHYVWKTEKSWVNCRQLVIKFSDGSYARANFKFSK